MIVNALLAAFGIVILFCIIKNRIDEKHARSFLDKDITGSLRGIAIIAIVFSHIMQAEPSLVDSIVGRKYAYMIVFSWGGIGVAIFFLLSGYGCFLSISRSENTINWLIRHVVKCLLYFLSCFIFVVLVRIFVLGEDLDNKECLWSFFALKLPGTSSWYFKIQLLFYLLLTISDRIKKNQCVIVTVFVLIYAAVASNCGLPDYWWKTSMCYAAGCILARYKDIFTLYAKKVWVLLAVIGVGSASFVYTKIDFHYILIPQLAAYVLIAVCIIFVWNWMGGKNVVFEKLGKCSLAMYLVHIGVVDTVYALQYNTNSKTIIFVGLIVFGTLITYLISEKGNRLLSKRIK